MTGLLILAGGKAKRLQDKMFLKIDNKEIIRFVYDSFKNFEVEEKCIAIKEKHFERMEKIFRDEINNGNLKLLIDETTNFAPIYGILNMEKMKNEEIFLVAGDSLFASKIYEKILRMRNKNKKMNNYDAIVPLHKFIEPLNALYNRKKILNACKVAIKSSDISIKRALSELNVYYAKFNEREFVNINTIEDLKRMKNLNKNLDNYNSVVPNTFIL